jgi:hypothetical protein
MLDGHLLKTLFIHRKYLVLASPTHSGKKSNKLNNQLSFPAACTGASYSISSCDLAINGVSFMHYTYALNPCIKPRHQRRQLHALLLHTFIVEALGYAMKTPSQHVFQMTCFNLFHPLCAEMQNAF